MPLTATYSEDTVHKLAPDDATFQKAQEIAKSKRFVRLGVSSDGSWLLGTWKGSGRDPYHFSADFHDPEHPALRSNSPSRQSPDKFSLALMLAYLQNPSDFGTEEPSDDLLLKRE